MAAYVKVTYSVSSTTTPTLVARYAAWQGHEPVDDWIDHVTIGSSGGTVISIEPWAPPDTNVDFYAYQFPTTGIQDLYFFSKTVAIPDYAFINVIKNYAPGYILSIDCSQENNDIIAIGESTFSLNHNLQSVYLSNNITTIGRNAFEQDSAMTVFNIPTGLTTIRASMLANCSSLTSITVPDQITSIGNSAFFNCSGITSLHLGSGLTSLGVSAFKGCSSLTSITATSESTQSWYTSSFQDVHTGGTLYYPAAAESEYGPESGWLSTDQYMLGYYEWNGVATGDTPATSWVWLNPSSRTVDYNSTRSAPYVYYSGCSIVDSATSAISAFTYTISGDNFVTEITAQKQYSTDINRGRASVRVSFTQNTSPDPRECYIIFTFYDTDGNEYHDTFHLTQRGALAVWVTPSTSTATSAQTVAYAAFSGLNETVATYTYAVQPYSTYPLIPLTVSNEGDQLTFNFSPNPLAETRMSHVYFTANTVSGNEYYLFYELTQEPATGDPYITSSFGSEEVVGSGSTTLTGTVYPVLCEYDHLTYMTGGSIPGMVVTTNGTQMFISVPANNTNQSRVGYVYITFYDTDGYTYQQTITIRQATGSGPGPGPDPDTGFVYTSFTISDNEQHRFFPEAQPGVTYYAAGQYYKTISACEARYSLYYVNSYGGVDVLPFKEKSWKKSDTITRFNYSRSFRNNTLEFENVNYMNEIKPSYELHTGWLSDEQSQRMHELVESTIVYLYDAIEKEYTPVVMTDKKLEYKTYHNQGKKFYNYTITVEESQSKERR